MPKKKEYNPDVYEIGEKIRSERQEHGLSEVELGAEINTKGNVISRYEIGETEMGISKFFLLADSLHIPPQKLFPDRYHDAENDELLHIFSELNFDGRGLLLLLARLLRQDFKKSSE